MRLAVLFFLCLLVRLAGEDGENPPPGDGAGKRVEVPMALPQ